MSNITIILQHLSLFHGPTSTINDTQVNSQCNDIHNLFHHIFVYGFINLETYHHHSSFIGSVPNVNNILVALFCQKYFTQIGEFFRIGNTRMTFLLELSSYQPNHTLFLPFEVYHPESISWNQNQISAMQGAVGSSEDPSTFS